MEKIEYSENAKVFMSNPQILENYQFLNKMGIINLVDSLSKEIRNYKTLFTGALDIFNRTNVSDILDAAVWQISDHFLPSFIGFIWRPLANKEDINIKGYRNYKQADLKLNVDSIACFKSFFEKNPKPINYSLLAAELEEADIFAALNPEAVIPIIGPDGFYGLVLTGRKILEDQYSDAELVYLQEIVSFVSQAIQNYLLYDKTLRDLKTGLFNNGFFMTRLNDEIARARRSDSIFSIIMMDVDMFKNFNDSFGHLAGDKVLETLAQVIKKEFRTEDIPSRFGGEEFSVLLPNADRDAAWIVAERLRRAVESMKVEWDIPLPQVTISVGIFTYNKDADISGMDMIKRTDEALYLSKKRGRNCCTCWNSGLMARIERMGLTT
jgi:diguanylate cyclase (GGDEF)-like protein